MEIPYTKEEVIAACKETIRANNFTNAYLRPFAFLGHVGLGLNPKSHRADMTVAAMEWGAYLGEEGLAQGVDVCVSSWSRLAPNTMPTAAKAGGNYLSSQLISGEAKRNGYAEGIALDVNGYLSEGAGENLFVVKKGVLYTPPTTACILPGLTRDTIIHLAKQRGYEVREEAIAREACIWRMNSLWLEPQLKLYRFVALTKSLSVTAGVVQSQRNCSKHTLHL